MEIITGIEQGTEEWLQMRLGVATASKFKDVMAGGAGKTRTAYLYQLAAELITGEREESYSNKYMEWGTENEPAARAMYELESGNEVVEVAFIKYSDYIGCSPDGLVGNDGLTEYKCPKTTTQIETFLSGKMPTGHKPQVQGNIWIAEREWCDFVSFDPRIDGASSLFIERQYRDDDYIKKLEQACDKFVNELLETIEKLKG